MGRGAAAAGVAGAGLAELDELEGAGAGDRLHVAAEIDDRALAGEDAARGRRRDDGAGDSAGAVDRDRASPRGLIAGATSIAALNGELLAWTSLVASTASTSIRPIREKPATMPGVTHLPRASTTVRARRHRDVARPPRRCARRG